MKTFIKNKNRGSRFVKLYSDSSKLSPEYSKGYAILFTVVVVSIISMITMGLANTAYKQMILSSVAKDSTTAFFEADLGAECALYVEDSRLSDSWLNSGSFTCVGRTMNYTKSTPDTSTVVFKLEPTTIGADKCFRGDITKIDRGTYTETIVISKGYNICDSTNIRTVERSLKITY